MRVAVTDATGRVGRRIAAALVADRHEVLRLTFTDEHTEGATPWPDPAKSQARLLRGIDCLFAVGLNTETAPEDVTGQEDVIRAAARAGVAQVVALSSTSLYSPAVTERGTATEQTGRRCPGELDALGTAAHHLEEVLHAVASDTKVTVIRAPMVLCPDGETSMALVAQLLNTADIRGCPDRLQGIDADDLAKVMVSVLRAPRAVGLALNLAGPATAHMDDVLSEVQRIYTLLTEFNPTSVNLRPEYRYAAPLVDDTRARKLLPKRADTDLWKILAQLVQRYVTTARATGELPAVQLSISEAKRAVQERRTPLQGRVGLVTGATDGIGRATALMLSRLGARVIAVGRNKAAGAELEHLTQTDPQYQPIEFIAADLTSISELRRLARSVAATTDTLDYLINNAGAAFSERTVTVDGLEAAFALNTVTPIVLPQLLMQPLQAAASARIINLNSNAHRMGRPAYDDLQSEKDYVPMRVYATTKLYQAMLTRCMAEKLRESTVVVHSLHPGPVRTEIETKNGLGAPPVHNLGPQVQQRLNTQREARRRQMISPEEAAAHVVNLAISSEYDGLNGLYVDQSERVTNFEGAPISDEAWTLWETCARLAGFTEVAKASNS